MAVVAAGILLRIILFLQNRNLIMDEVNLVRNLHERSFGGLLYPLSYEQFAPVPFLFFSKISLTIFGAYEWAVRLYPLCCGIACLVLFYKILAQLHILRGGIYSLLLLAGGLIYVRYATEFKQYSGDEMLTCALVLLALNMHPQNTGARRLFYVWMVAGSIAIWMSMPAVFVLAGVGVSFVIPAVKMRDRPMQRAIAGIGLVWISQFALHYFLLLKPGIHSGYLQSWHKDYFLTLLPTSADDWQHNADALSGLFTGMGGHWVLSVVINLLLASAGIFILMKKNKPVLALTMLPVLLLLLAAGLHQYTLLPRVSLFSYPLMLVWIGVGLEQIFRRRFAKFILPIVAICCLVAAYNFNAFRYIISPLKIDRTTDNFAWIQAHSVPAGNCYIHEFAWPQYLYQETIRPDSGRRASLKGMTPFTWHTNMDSLCENAPQQVIFIFSWISEEELNNDRAAFTKYLVPLDSVVGEDRRVYLFSKR